MRSGGGQLPASTLLRYVAGTFMLTLSNPTTILSTGVGWLRQAFDERWQRAVNLRSAVLLAGLGLRQLGQLVIRE